MPLTPPLISRIVARLPFMGLLCLVALSAACDSRSGGSSYTHSSAGIPARYADATPDVPDSDDEDSEELKQAKQDFEDASTELTDAVSALSYTPWSQQMHTIQSNLDDAETALERLESIRPRDPSVMNARNELDTMRSHMERLRYENWRRVRPDLGETAESIGQHATTVSTEPEEDE